MNSFTEIASRHNIQSPRLNTRFCSPFSALAYETTTSFVVILVVIRSSQT